MPQINLTDEDRLKIIEVYRCYPHVKRVARSTGWSIPTVRRTLQRAGIRTPGSILNHQPHHSPSPEEIAEETAKIRSTWSENEEKARRVQKAFHWTVPACQVLMDGPVGSHRSRAI
jgi:hypothetical protein